MPDQPEPGPRPVPPAAVPAAPRYLLLDHGRGFAALAVLGFHAFYLWRADVLPAPAGLGWLQALADQGHHGVGLFFVISGYCVAQLAWREVHQGRGAGHFLLGRLLRIFPPYWMAALASLALFALASQFHYPAPSAPGGLRESIGPVLSNVFLFDAFLGRPGFLLVAWSLSWELAYYAVVAALLPVARRSPAAAVVLAAALTGLALVPSLAASFLPLAGWPAFACGAAVFASLLAVREGRRAWPWLAAVVLTGLAGGVVGSGAVLLPLCAGFALLLHALHPHDARLATWGPLAWLGQVGTFSYSLYLVHAPVVSLLQNFFARLVPVPTELFLGPILVSVLAALLAGGLFFAMVERPLEHGRRWLLAERHSSPTSP